MLKSTLTIMPLVQSGIYVMHSLLCSKSYELLWQLYCYLRKCLPV